MVTNDTFNFKSSYYMETLEWGHTTWTAAMINDECFYVVYKKVFSNV